ncbi:MAG: class B sortase [Coriobacteriia bacterium]|nr:class B sortase [Coriobacteriia bacterium]
MGVASKIGAQAVKAANSVVNLAILVVILLLLVCGGYALWDSHQVYAVADSARYAAYKPSALNQGLSFKDLQTINPEVVSWLTVYGTHIDYPVAQAKDNLKYINTDATGKYSLSGSLFLDADCSPDFSDFSSIIYGHHMNKDTMFGEIGLFADLSYFNARKYGVLYYGGREQGLEFFEFMHVDAYDSAIYRTKVSAQDAQAYLDLLKRSATHLRAEVSVTPTDRIVLLSTCSEATTNGRDILLAKITDDVHGDPFASSGSAGRTGISGVDAVLNFWASASVPLRIVMVALPFLLIVVLVVFLVRRRKRRQKGQDLTPAGDR